MYQFTRIQTERRLFFLLAALRAISGRAVREAACRCAASVSGAGVGKDRAGGGRPVKERSSGGCIFKANA